MNIFAGMEKFGLKDLQNTELFVKKNTEAAEPGGAKAEERPFLITDYVYERSTVCPVCDKTITYTALRGGKLRPVSIDYDFRPIYREPISPMFYDVISCNICGYTAITQMFNKILDRQANYIKETISPSFVATEYPMQLTLQMVVERYTLALLNAVVKKGKDGEKAYLSMKLAWLYRSLKNQQMEMAFIEKAHDGFASAFSTDVMPILGLDENSVMYLIAAYAKALGSYEEAVRLASILIVKKAINPRLKERARDLKDAIHFEKKKLENAPKKS